MDEFAVVYKEGELYIRMPKELDHASCEEIREAADRYMMNRNVSRLVFDFAETRMMDSSGIGVILGRIRKLHFGGGRVMAINLNERIRRIFSLCGLDKIVELPQQ